MEDEMRHSRSIKAEATLACGFLLMALVLAAPSSGSYVPAPRKPETDGLSRNPDDCVKYGCIDNGGG
jgi:hypothetical protein